MNLHWNSKYLFPDEITTTQFKQITCYKDDHNIEKIKPVQQSNCYQSDAPKNIGANAIKNNNLNFSKPGCNLFKGRGKIEQQFGNT
jgi:hypothetical protein